MSDEKIESPRQRYDELYHEFQRQEAIPVHDGVAVDDVREVEVAEWERTGGRGAFIDIKGMESICDTHIHEIPPGETLKTQRHLFEAIVFVVSGAGVTTIGEGDDRQTFEWDDGALFYLPHNTPYRHSNIDADEPVRLLSTTSLPLFCNLFRSLEAVWDIDCYDQWSSIKDDDFYSSVSELKAADDTRTYWDSNFVPDVTKFDNLASWSLRGDSNRSVFFPFTNSSMDSHISEFDPGRYKKAHRHTSGANILLLSGEGYTLMWREEEDEPRRVDWSPYTFFTPSTMEFHQHFNTSPEPARYVVFHGPQQRMGMQLYESDVGDDPLANHQVEYYEEDPEIREMFQEELEKNGVENQMDDELYTKD
jgi:quercetin dioxygenase-like cupin family protein